MKRFLLLLIILFLTTPLFSLRDKILEVEKFNPSKVKSVKIMKIKTHHLFRGRKDPDPFKILKNRKEIKEFFSVFKLQQQERYLVPISGEMLKINFTDNKGRLKSYIFFQGGSGMIVMDVARKYYFEMSDVLRFVKWLKRIGLDSPLKNYWDGIKREEKIKEDRAKWMKTMPKGLNLTFREMNARNFEVKETMMKKVREHYSEEDIVLAFLFWMGSGSGPWYGFASYELVAVNFLNYFPLNHIYKSLEKSSFNSTHLEGAARYFSSGFWNNKRVKGNEMPEKIKKKLMDHVLESKDEDKIMRFKSLLK